MSWDIIGKHICAIEGNQVGHLNAIDVYKALSDSNYIAFGKVQPEIKSYFSNIYFSNMSVEATIILYSIKNEIMITIAVDKCKVDIIDGVVIDQIIIDNEWHYISNAEDINDIVSGLIKSNNNQINICEYLEIIKRNQKYNLVEDKIHKKNLQKSLDFTPPTGLVANLFDYQKKGYTWMNLMLNAIHGCILGDEMGLGKTLQAISLILDRSNNSKKTLVIAPVSLLENWKSELKKFAPYVRSIIHHGSNRTGNYKVLLNYDCVITSYSNAVSDNSMFNMINWNLLVIDEAQNIKNPNSKRRTGVKNIHSENRLAITGTPFENHMIDIWSLIDFIVPTYLGTQKEFNQEYTDDINGATKIEPILSSFMIRRLVKDVARDLPEKVIIPQPIIMSDFEIELYEEIRNSLSNSNKISLPLLTKLRMFCTHPQLTNSTNESDPYKTSIKYQRCCQILDEIFMRNEKALIFTSYQSMFEIFENDISNRFSVEVRSINGTTPIDERQRIVNWFNNYNKSALLVLNPVAAGTGLNITGANHVIHYNLEWNPAKEDQASARAYRRGQTKTVFIYRLYYQNTVEQIINQRIETKRDMASNAVRCSGKTKSDYEDILSAIKMSPRGNL
ncbi:DEAD/DEAH box helicase [Holdemanella biformis]